MKFLKAILLGLLLPISGFGATNLFNDVWISGSLRMTFGTPGANRVLTSDAAGVATWQVPITAGDVFTNGFGSTKLNFYNTGVTNDMRRGPSWETIVSLNTNTHIYSTIFGANRYAEGGLLIKPVGGTALGGAGFGVAAIVGNAASPEFINLAVYMEGGRGTMFNARGIDYDMSSGVPFQIRDGTPTTKLSLTSSFDSTGTNFFGRLGSGEAAWIRGSTVTISSNLVINGNSIIGSQSSDAITINSATAAIPNGLNFGSNLLVLSNATGRVGINKTQPAGTLHVAGTAVQPHIVLDNTGTGGTNWYIWSTENSSSGGAGKLLFGTTLTTLGSKVAFAAGGSVGINNTFPSNKFSINVPLLGTNTAEAFITSGAAGNRALILQSAIGQTANIFETWSSNSTTPLVSINGTNGRIVTADGFTASGTVGGSRMGGGTAVNGQILTIDQGAVAQTNLVINAIAGATGPNVLLFDTNGNRSLNFSHNSFTFGTNGTAFANIPDGSFTFDPPSIAAGTTFRTNVTVSAAIAGRAWFAGSTDYSDPLQLYARCTNNGNVLIILSNPGLVTAIDAPSQTVTLRAIQ